MKMSKHRAHALRTLIVVLITLITLIACGGGGGGGESVTVKPPSNIIETPKPVLVKPNYQGSTSSFDIPRQDATEISLDLTSAIDFLNLLAFGATQDHFLIHPSEQAPQSPDDNDQIVCQSGSVTTTEIKANEELKIDYDNCVQAGIKIDGSLTLYLVRLRDSVLHDMDIVVNLTMNDTDLNEVLTLAGYIKIREGTQDVDTIATYQILFGNESNEQIYFDDFTASIRAAVGEYGIDYQGKVYFSQLGRLTASTQDIYNSQKKGQLLEISSNNRILVDILLQNQIEIIFDQNTIPLIISLNSIPDSIYDNENTSPNAVISSSSLQTDSEVDLLLSASDSNDSDLDILMFSWKVISAPNGANWSITQDVETAFNGDLPGEYIIELQVDDNQATAVTTSKVVRVLKGLPNGSISSENSHLMVDGEFIGQVDLLNDEYDGPFEYRLAYGPAGMKVDPEGGITWNAHIPDFNLTTQVNFAIEVFNSDKNTRMLSSVAVQSGLDNKLSSLRKSNVFNQLVHNSVSQSYRDSNNREYYSAFVNPTSVSKIPYQFGLDNSDTIQPNWAIVSLPDNFEYAATYDVNNDGFLDHFLTTYNQKQDNDEPYELWLMDGETKQLSLFAIHNQNVWGTFEFKDMDGQQGIELIAHSNQSILDVVVYSIETRSLIYQSSEPHSDLIGYCDLNGDGISEVITESIVVDLATDKTIYQFLGTQSIKLLPSDNGDGESCEILIDEFSNLSLLKFENGEFAINPFTVPSFNGGNYLVGNFDSDKQSEILFISVDTNNVGNWVVVDFDNNGNTIERPLTLPDNYDLRHSNIITVLDLDGNNIDEILYYHHVFLSDTWNLFGFDVSQSELTEKFSSDSYFAQPANSKNSAIVSLQEDQVKAFYNSIYDNAKVVTFSSTKQTTSVEIPLGEIIGYEKSDGDEFFYTHNTFGANNRFQIIKYTNDGTLIWQTEVSNSYRADILQDIVIDRGLLVITGNGNDYYQVIINSEDGTILRESISGRFTAISPDIGDKTKLINGSLKEVLGYSGGNLDIKFSGLNDSFGIDLNRINDYSSFIQYDDDQQLEVLVYYTALSEEQSLHQSYVILDSETWTKEPLKRGEKGFVPQDAFIPELILLDCFELDNKCRNSLKRQGHRVEMLDKLSGEVIWKSPDFADPVKNVKFEIQQNNHVRIAIETNEIYVYE